MSRWIALFMTMSGKNAHTPLKLSTTGLLRTKISQEIPFHEK